MNWGGKIVFSFVLFAGFVFTLVYKMITSGNDLVSKEYYLSGEQVNAELKLRDASSNIKDGFSIEVLADEKQAIVLSFRNIQNPLIGNVILTCLSSDRADQKERLALVQTDSIWQQTIALTHFEPGNWLCEIRGKSGEKDFVVKDEFRIYAAHPLP